MSDAQDKHNEMLAPTNFLMFELNQRVFYMCENRIHTGEVRSRVHIDNRPDDNMTDSDSCYWQPFGQQAIRYGTIHGVFDQDQLLGTQEALLEDLMGGNPT